MSSGDKRARPPDWAVKKAEAIAKIRRIDESLSSQEDEPGVSPLESLMMELQAVIALGLPPSQLIPLLQTSRFFARPALGAYIFREFCKREWRSPFGDHAPYRIWRNCESLLERYRIIKGWDESHMAYVKATAMFWRQAYVLGSYAIRLTLMLLEHHTRCTFTPDMPTLRRFVPFELGPAAQALDPVFEYLSFAGCVRHPEELNVGPPLQPTDIRRDPRLSIARNNWLTRPDPASSSPGYPAVFFCHSRTDITRVDETALPERGGEPISQGLIYYDESNQVFTSPFGSGRLELRLAAAVVDARHRRYDPLVQTRILAAAPAAGAERTFYWGERPVITGDVYAGWISRLRLDMPVVSVDLAMFARAIDVDAVLDLLADISTEPTLEGLTRFVLQQNDTFPWSSVNDYYGGFTTAWGEWRFAARALRTADTNTLPPTLGIRWPALGILLLEPGAMNEYITNITSADWVTRLVERYFLTERDDTPHNVVFRRSNTGRE